MDGCAVGGRRPERPSTVRRPPTAQPSSGRSRDARARAGGGGLEDVDGEEGDACGADVFFVGARVGESIVVRPGAAPTQRQRGTTAIGTGVGVTDGPGGITGVGVAGADFTSGGGGGVSGFLTAGLGLGSAATAGTRTVPSGSQLTTAGS